ncbi:putative uncharacterized protein DDB_G0274405 isoform X1 [Apis laboriosa]|uniref:putative uncharacterized protein DDB_G0274405 isoform X1 n=1 Tax=Apis laboriosa TaxID=183418 RepID=UPI001CC74AE3|nr:putative uncharacterized protein DDB_G0274405 isoform X1 [Apis laboriosa]
MESTNSTMDLAYSFYSESSNSSISLNKAMLMSVDDNTLNSNNNSCYHSYVEEQNETLFEHTDSTSLKPLSNFTINSNSEQENSDNLEDTQHTNIEEENHEGYIPLRTLLRNMFEEILGKYNGITRQSNVSSINRSSNSDNSMDNWDNADEVNNNLLICQTQKSNNIVITTIDNVKDPDKIIGLSSQHILDSRSINTILENSNESSSNSQINDSSKWSGRLIDKLRNFTSHRREKKYRNHIFITSDISNESISSSISGDVKKVTEEIFQKANNLSMDDSLKLKSNNATPNNEKVKSPIKKKRRSVSLPKYMEDENTERQNEKILINNSQKSYTPPYIRNRSNYISTSPIKPVKYLRQYFANLDNKNNKKNIKRSPKLNKYIRRHRIPYIRVIPATPK